MKLIKRIKAALGRIPLKFSIWMYFISFTVIDRAFEDQCTTANPRLPLVTELKQILLDSYYGNM